MKKIIKTLILLVITLHVIPASAANYEMKELIPVDTETTIVTDNFSYKNFYYNDNKMEAEALKNNFIIFGGIKNLRDEDSPVSISIGIFDEDKKNIGTINYCSTNDKTSAVAETILKPDEERSYVIEVNKKVLATNKTVKDVKYIAVLDDNINCRTAGSQDFVGKKVEEIKVTKNSILEYSSTKIFIRICSVIAVLLLIVFLYKFMFTNAFRNYNGDDVRREFIYKNKQLAKERLENPKPEEPKIPKEIKSTEILAQEQIENKKENQEGTDLHNMYK